MTSLLANGIAMLAARLIAPALSFGINVGIARLLGPEVLGGYVHLLALAAIFQTAAGAGLTGLLTRELAAHPERTPVYLRRARSLAGLTGLLTTAAFLLAARFVAPERWIPAAILATTVLPSAWISVQEAFFMASRTHYRVTLVALGENALKLALAAVTFKVGGGLLMLCLGVALSRFAALLAGIALMHRAGVRGSWSPAPWSEIRDLALSVAPFAFLLVLSTTYFKLDVLLVDALLGPKLTGVYGAALALYSVALLLPDSVMAAIYPRLAARHRESMEGYAEATRISASFVTAGLVPVSLGLICFADPLLRLAYGGRYAAAAPVLRLLAASLPIHAANGALGQALLAGRFQGAMVRVVLGGLAIHAVLCSLLLSHMGLTGAPMALILSSGTVVVWAARIFHRRVSPLALAPRTLWGLAAIATTICLTLAAPSGWKYVTGAGSVVLLAVAGWRALLTGSDWERLRQVVSRSGLGAR